MSTQARILCLLLATLCVSHAHGQKLRQGDYMANLAAAERAAPDNPAQIGIPPQEDAARSRLSSFQQALAVRLADVGDTDGAIATFDLLAPMRQLQLPNAVARMPAVADAVAEDAIDAIVAQARTKRVVLLNEAHHVPMHRAFARKLAARLRALGYRYLACETFNGGAFDEARPAAPGRTVQATGYYTKDPAFAGFVNSALADGWTLVAYEADVAASAPGTARADRLRLREEGQARHLVERIFAKDKEAKVFIYVGYGHVHKNPSGDGATMMAEYLRRMTGLDTLNVDQVQFFAHPDPRKESPAYAGLVKKFVTDAPFVLRAPDGSHPLLGNPPGSVDLEVIYPRYAAHAGRPDWLRTLAGRSPRTIPADLLPRQGRRLVKAYRKDDGADAVPADIVLVEQSKPAPALMLPAGEFRYTIEDDVAPVAAATGSVARDASAPGSAAAGRP